MFQSPTIDKNLAGALAIGMAVAGFAGPANALSFDQDVTPDVIFGSGNANGFFTVDIQDNVELGLRAKIPYVGVLHSNGDGTYSYSLAETALAAPPIDGTSISPSTPTSAGHRATRSAISPICSYLLGEKMGSESFFSAIR